MTRASTTTNTCWYVRIRILWFGNAQDDNVCDGIVVYIVDFSLILELLLTAAKRMHREKPDRKGECCHGTEYYWCSGDCMFRELESYYSIVYNTPCISFIPSYATQAPA